jgi:RNA polymerase subunit RPABC4/transcription elongation factor Spt4
VSVAPPAPAPTSAPAPGTIACPRCGAQVAPDQEWCLNCGAAARTRLVPTPNWRAPLLVLALIATLAGIALAVAFVGLTNDNEPAAPVSSQAPTAGATAAPQPTQAPAQPAPTEVAPTQPAPAQPAPAQSAPTQATPTRPSTATATSAPAGG